MDHLRFRQGLVNFRPDTSFNKWAMSDVYKQLTDLRLLGQCSRNECGCSSIDVHRTIIPTRFSPTVPISDDPNSGNEGCCFSANTLFLHDIKNGGDGWVAPYVRVDEDRVTGVGCRQVRDSLSASHGGYDVSFMEDDLVGVGSVGAIVGLKGNPGGGRSRNDG